ncbi:hypothetical protein ILUMI_15421 [Ignelater luminosus]|uniref:Uncharacterized protein n=1 Tax=Ignelater luminosus TaxID=2038154 RepID=A0A8K0CUQ9_IGNLU|nr:hypothetical protein ILUMI_15421 [Ignelater luminosus]
MWCLNPSSENLVDFGVYQGTNPYGNDEYEREFQDTYGVAPKGARRPSMSKSSLTFNRISDNLQYDGCDDLLVQTTDYKEKDIVLEKVAPLVFPRYA